MSNSNDFENRLIDKSSLVLQDVYYYRKLEPNYKICEPQLYTYEENCIEFLSYKRNPTDKLDCINFSIRKFYKLKKEQSRIYVVIYGNDRKTGQFERFECYTSISDGSFWRFCVKLDGEEKFNKGYNYISSTFINIYLQKFINENMRKFRIIEFDSDNILCINTSELNSYLKNRILENTYVSGNQFFLIINKIFPPITYMVNYRNCLAILLKELANYIQYDNITEIDICSKIFCELNKENLNKDISLTAEISRRTFYGKIKKVFSQLFLYYFTLKFTTKKELFIKEFNVGDYKFIAKTNSIEIEFNLIPGKIYILYYMIYSDLNKKMKSIKTFIHIIPKLYSNSNIPNKITIWGLDERYIAAGVMLNKVFDYQTQAPVTVFTGHIEARSSGYRFIGDLTNYEFLPE
jgi:hypothetical protein